MPKRVLYFIVIPLLFAFPVFSQSYNTSFGTIEKGYTQEQVIDILGNPHHISSHDKTDIWYYYFGEDNRLFIYFMDGKVIEVRNKEQVRI